MSVDTRVRMIGRCVRVRIAWLQMSDGDDARTDLQRHLRHRSGVRHLTGTLIA